MATAVGVSGASPNTVSDEERRWVVVGICLTKVLTPALRDVLGNDIPKWYQNLLLPPYKIHKQTFGSHIKNLPPSTLPNLNYKSINNNLAVRKPSNYDYAVKDPMSLAKLFIIPSMASFTGFDQTMDESAALSVVAEAQPFHASGAGGMAKKIRSHVRNEWAHCNFSHWTDVIYQAALKDMETLINNINLTPAEKKRTLDDLDGWKQKGLELCFGQPVDSELLKLVNTEVAELRNSVKLWKENVECNQSKLLNALETIEKSLTQEIQDLRERQLCTEQDVEQLRVGQLALYETISRKHEEEPRYLFMAPKQTEWFSGRESELDLLRNILENENTSGEEKVIVAAVSGLGGSGKTSLTAEYIHKWKDYYQGGIYWFSGEDDVKLKSSVDDIAAQFNTLHDDSLDATLSKTLAVFSRITKPWLMIIDDMDELNLSQNLLKLVSGSWQANTACFGHLIITTRRTPRELKEDLSGFKESRCLKLDSFGSEEAKNFVFKRTGIARNEQTDVIADLLFQKLGGLPLALEQACAYIVSLECTLSDYFESYEKQSLKLLNKKNACSLYGTSQERLAVRTTWLLNFEHIRKNENGMIATRFLNASAFMNRNELQKELINVGEPRVDDKAYCDHVSTSLGSLEVLKLLTDFSLFKKTHNSSLSVHRLVQEVIRENLKPEEKVESIVDAARLLCFAFSTCPSPDILLESELGEHIDRSSLHPTSFSRFYKWHKLCLHAHEIKRNLERLLDIFRDVKEKTVFLPEVARIVYECALHLNVNNSSSQAKTVADFANRILDWGCNVISEEKMKALFPHMFPLSESLRRLIQYSCKAAVETNNPTTPEISANDSLKSEIEKMRLEGNKIKKTNFQEALEIYSSCIDKSKGTDSFDPKFLRNRASAYLNLKQYMNALNDAEEYIKYSPQCWRGHAKKALALHGLNEKWDAVSAAALAFYHNRNIFANFAPFKDSFPNLKQCIHVCDNVSSLVSLPSQLSYGTVSDMPRQIIVLKPGEYRLSTQLRLGDVILVGVGDSSLDLGVTLYFGGNFGLLSHKLMAAVNISFIFNLGNWCTIRESEVKVSECSITSNHGILSAFVSQGTLLVKKTRFVNCKSTALLVTGNAEVEDSVFSGNMYVGLKVVGPGNLVLKNSKFHGNQWGLDVNYGTCEVTGCQIYDNKKIGVGVRNGTAKVTRNEIFHNDRHGIYLSEKSFAIIEENEIFENGWLGISKTSNAWCRVSRNKIFQNKCGGIHVVPTTKASGHRQSAVIESNQIFSNEGPGIDQANAHDDKIGSEVPSLNDCLIGFLSIEDNFIKAECTENIFKNNIERDSEPPSQIVTDICFFCHKKGQLKKCARCFTAGYCNSECQKSDWKTHKNNCAQLLEKYSVLVKVLPLSLGLIGDKQVCEMQLEGKAPFPWLEPSGPQYAEAPKRGKRFIVKIQAGDSWRRSNDGGTLLAIEDRSLTINGDLDIHEHSGRIYHLVRECGSNCNSYGWKKKFFWALLAEDKTVRVFTSDFPTYQCW